MTFFFEGWIATRGHPTLRQIVVAQATPLLEVRCSPYSVRSPNPQGASSAPSLKSPMVVSVLKGYCVSRPPFFMRIGLIGQTMSDRCRSTGSRCLRRST